MEDSHKFHNNKPKSSDRYRRRGRAEGKSEDDNQVIEEEEEEDARRTSRTGRNTWKNTDYIFRSKSCLLGRP